MAVVTIDSLRALYATLERSERVREFYRQYPRNAFWDRENKACSTDILSRAADVRHLIHEMQRTDLFSVNSDSDVRELAVDWLVEKYRDLGLDVLALPREVEESELSYVPNCVVRGGRRLSVDFFRVLSVASDIRRYLARSGPLHVVELGGGPGHLARLLRIMGTSRSHIVIDLPESLVYSYAFLTASFPLASTVFVTSPDEARAVKLTDFDFAFIPSCFADLADFDGAELFVNTASLGEMRNETIRYWMDFVQTRLPVRYLFTQNRFLNTIEPVEFGWRWNENECSVHYDASWTISNWTLEPPWFRCPYVVPMAARHLEIAATRTAANDPAANAAASQALLEQVKKEDWYRLPDLQPYMTMRQNPFVLDVGRSGALFKLWESIRLHPTAEAVSVLLRYLDRLPKDSGVVFEEARYYENLLLELARNENAPWASESATALRDRRSNEPFSVGAVALVGELDGYNLVEVELVGDAASMGASRMKYLAVAKALGFVSLFRERVGERELAPCLLSGDSLTEVREKARQHGRPECELLGSDRGYNFVRAGARFLAVAQSLGPTSLLAERVGERDLPPVILTGENYDEVHRKVRGLDPSEASISFHFGETERIARALIGGERMVWRREAARTTELCRIPSMICADESLYLYWLAKHYATGAGAIIDLGPLAGGSSLALASGLSENVKVSESEKRVYSFDLWSYQNSHGQFFPTVHGVDGIDVLPAFLANLGDKAKYVVPAKGDVRSQYWHDVPVEVIFIDLAKSVDTWVHVARQFFTQAIPGRTILVNQDMISVDCPWIPLYMQLWRDHFDYLDSPYGGSIAYRFKSHIPLPEMDQSFYESIDTDTACALYDQARSELRGWAALYMPLCKATFLLSRGEAELAREAIEEARAHPDYKYEHCYPAFDYFKLTFGVQGSDLAWLNDLSN